MKRLYKYIFSITLMIGISLLLICFSSKNLSQKNESVTTISDSSFFFDTFVTITLYKDNANINYEELLANSFKLCAKYENIFSTTLSNSELYNLNQCDENVKLSKDFQYLLERSTDFEVLTKGAFNVKLGAICNLWNFKNSTIPNSQEINSCLNSVNSYDYILTDNTFSWVGDKNIKKPLIDLGGIAKGYIADKLKEYLTSQGVSYGIINLGGNVLLIGSKPDKSSYSIGIKYPFSDNDYIATVNLSDYSVVTSGIYERYFEKDNKLYHHLLNPTTGYPVENQLYSVTIIAKASTTADALSTAVFVLGMDEGLKLVNSLEDVYAVFVDSNEKITISDGLLIKNSSEISIN